MKILLAGYNVDTEVLKEYEKMCSKRPDATPETLSASYARISRDPRPIDVLRQAAREEVEKSRKSNQAIIFKMGHHSVAEHAVFNFDIINISRLAIEDLEKFRLCSFTEKSQRYITLGNDFVIPAEIRSSSIEQEFIDVVKQQNALYHEMNSTLKEYVFKKHPVLAESPKNHNMLEGWAKEDARYITALATEGQLGMTINARNLEFLFRRFASHPLKEIQDIGKRMYDLVKDVAPSIILFTSPNDYDSKTLTDLQKCLEKDHTETSPCNVEEVSLLRYTPKADDILAASLMHHVSGRSFSHCIEKVNTMSLDKKKEIIKTTFQHMEFFDSPLREFEFLNLLFEITLSASCFAQLKRHRMSTLITQDYDPSLGLTIPESIIETGFEEKFRKTAQKSEELYYKIQKTFKEAAPYILTNAHRRRVLFGVNARELYHISRLREDSHAQWDIQRISAKLSHLASEAMPLAMMLIGSKEVYPEKFEKLFGKPPAFMEIPG